ncbi:MAG: hypothetical protein K5643_08080 [Saccharofermentans sp.]|nr:hypothetical protein [Saccharofermentans sp.]
MLTYSIFALMITLIFGYLMRKKESSGFHFADIPVSIILALSISAGFDTSPFYKGELELDSAIFVYIAERMHDGKVPYLDLFDHKGPALYFLEYAGTFLGKTGIWLILTLSLALSALLIIFTVRLFFPRLITQYSAAFFTLMTSELFVSLFCGGNYTETLALPAICYAFFVFSGFLIRGQYKSRDIILLGASFMYVLMLRANMISVWIVYVPVVIIHFIIKKQFSRFLSCTGLFAAGALLTAIPYIIYSCVTSSFTDYMRYYWRFNFVYTGSTYDSITAEGNLLYFLIVIIPVALILIISLFKGLKNRAYVINLIFIALSLITAFISARPYSHYVIPVLPAMILPAAFMAETIFSARIPVLHEFDPKTVLVPGIICSVGLCFFAVTHAMTMTGSEHIMTPDEKELAEYIENESTSGDDILFVGFPCTYYLSFDRSTGNKFFYQYPVTLSEELNDEFFGEISETRSSLLIINNGEFYGNTPLHKLNAALEKQLPSLGYTLEDHGSFLVYRYG